MESLLRRVVLGSTTIVVLATGLSVAIAGLGRSAVPRADDCFTITVTNTPLHPDPGATVCLPIDVPR
jgi:hypothetical protein